jgi:hypothetical protein
MENENLGGFQRALDRITGDKEMTEQIMSLIPSTVILPLYFKGETAKVEGVGEVVITDIAWKNGGYIYFFRDEASGDEVYTYEHNLELN